MYSILPSELPGLGAMQQGNGFMGMLQSPLAATLGAAGEKSHPKQGLGRASEYKAA